MVTRWRTAAEFGTFDAGLGEVTGSQKQILRTGLTVDLEPIRLSVADDLDRLGRRYVHQQDRHIEQLRQSYGTVRRLALGKPDMAHGVVAWRPETTVQQASGEPLDHLMVLGMDHDERAFSARHRQDVEHLPVVECQQVIGHVDLERSVAVADQRWQFLTHDLLGRIRDDQVEGIVDNRLRKGGLMILRDDLAQRLAAVLRGERDHRGGPAKRRRHCRTVEIVCADDPGRGALLDMAMAVDTAWQHQMSARIDLLRAGTEVLAEDRYEAILDANIAISGVSGGRHRAVADHQVEVTHAASLRAVLQRPSIGTWSSATVARREYRAKRDSHDGIISASADHRRDTARDLGGPLPRCHRRV